MNILRKLLFLCCMQRLLSQYTVQLDKALYAKDPAISDIGKEILKHGVTILEHEGLEAFTFKKLAAAMNSTESTLYRYFNNKHQLLMYLCSWYWSYLEWKMAFATANIEEPEQKLDNALKVLIECSKNTNDILDDSLLQKVVCAEWGKVFDAHHKEIDDLKGYYSSYNSLVERLSLILLENKKDLKGSHGLASAIIDTAMRELFFHFYLPSMNDATKSQHSMLHLLQLLTQSIRNNNGRRK